MTPTARSIQFLRREGYIVAKVEQRIPIPGKFGVTRDAFNFGDLLIAGTEPKQIALVQVTAAGDMNRRFRKIKGIPAEEGNEKQLKEAQQARENAIVWLEAGGLIFIHGWILRKKTIKRERAFWELLEMEVKRSDL